MKLGFTVATPEVRSKTMQAYTGPLEESLPTLAGLGYDGVELMVRNPRELNVRQIEHLLSTHHLVVAAVGTGQVINEDRLMLSDPDPSVRQAAIVRFRDVVDFAAAFGALITIGRVRGRRADQETVDQYKARLYDTLVPVLDYAASRRTRIVLEPQNRSVSNFVNTVADGLGCIAELGRDNLGTMLDTFHGNIEERSIAAALVQGGSKLWYVHVSDSNALAPSSGHLNFVEIMAVLKALAYDGFVTAEVIQKPDPRSAAKRTIDYLRMVSI